MGHAEQFTNDKNRVPLFAAESRKKWNTVFIICKLFSMTYDYTLSNRAGLQISSQRSR